jgi:hypothetical protein
LTVTERVPWVAQDGPQLTAIQKHWVEELFFGGAVGGGKSDYLLGDFAQDVPTYGPAWHGILFRKSYPQLEELVMRSKVIYPAWFGLDPLKAWNKGEHMWTWPNGSTLRFRHAEDDDSWMQYQGHQYTWMGFDELPHWSNPTFYQQLKTRLRSAHNIPNKRIRGTGNPGGVGHGWIKAYFKIDRFPLGSVLIPADRQGGSRMFIRSKVTDNRILLENDPKYIDRLSRLGSDALVKMYLEGDWNVIAGAFFAEFSTERHVLMPFEVPKDWLRFRSADWGSSAPFSVGWYAVSEGDVEVPYAGNERGRILIPRGAIVKYREWYGMKQPEEGEESTYNVGLKLTAEEFAQGIRDREESWEKFSMSVMDPSAFKQDGGPSIAERCSVRPYNISFQRADNQRKAGWDMMRARLKGDPRHDDVPMLFFTQLCPDSIRTIPMLQHDRGKAAGAIEDVDTESEDHAGDETRYACMARPWTRPGTPAKTVLKTSADYEKQRWPGNVVISASGGSPTTFNQAVEMSRRRRLEREGKL